MNRVAKHGVASPAGTSRRQDGVGMVEVLVALLIVSIGVLGYAGMQLFALRGAEESGSRVLATLLARDAIERIQLQYTLVDAQADVPRAQRDAQKATLDGFYFVEASWPTVANAGTTHPNTCITTTCTTNALAAADINQLAWTAVNTLPQGRIAGRRDCTGIPSPRCVIVSWQGVTPDQCIAGAQVNAEPTCVVMEVLVP